VNKRFNWRGLLLFAYAAVVIILDQYTKSLVRAARPLNTSWMPIPWLDPFVTLTHVNNTGSAFGLFHNMNWVFIIIASVATIAIVVYYRQISESSWLLRLAFGLQLGGIVGNNIDRIARGYVTDFVDTRIWPVFNVADSSLVVGTILLAIFALFIDREPQEAPQTTDEAGTSVRKSGKSA
jgi:signal peptidase II